MSKMMSLWVTASLVLGATSLAYAAPDAPDTAASHPHKSEKPMHRPHCFMSHESMHGMFKGIKLSDEQKQQMRDITKEAHQKMTPPSADFMKENQQIIASDKFDRARAEAQAEKVSLNAKERTLISLETQNKLYNILTAEQKKQYAEKASQRLNKPAEQAKHSDQDASHKHAEK